MRGSFAAADGFSGGSTPHEGTGAQRGYGRRGCSGFHPLEIAAIVLGFVFFWPLGLALLALKFWRGKNSPWWPAEWENWSPRSFAGGWARTGNSAFDDWKRAELDRLEAERRRLAEAERDFAFFLEQLRRAKDREEFERFMNERRAGSARPEGSPQG
jgi:hypothetical protein